MAELILISQYAEDLVAIVQNWRSPVVVDEALQEIREVIDELKSQAETEHVISDRARALIQKLSRTKLL